MLDTIRNNTRSIVIYLIFGALIVVFILSFGPQSGRNQSGCSPSAARAAQVNGSEITEASWRFGIMQLGGGGNATGERARRSQIREAVLDRLFVREILAKQGEDMGFRISDDEIRENIARGTFYVLGQKTTGRGQYIFKDETSDVPVFKASMFTNWAKSNGLGSVDRFIDEQRRELLAQRVLDLVMAGVQVSPEEVQHQYTLESSKVEIEYVAFPKETYRDALEPTAAELDEYLKAHETELKAQFDKEADRWKGRDKEVRVRDLFVKTERVAEPPPAPDKPAAPAPPPAPKPDPARAKADAALAKIKGGADFAATLKAMNPDAPRGGDLGWRPLRGLRLGAPVAEAVGKLDEGQTTGVVETPEGYHIVQLIDKREGDLTFDTVKRELAEDAYLDEKGKAAAKAEAEKALAAVKAGTPLDKQFAAEGGDAPAAGAKPRLQKGTDITRVGGYVAGIGTAPDMIKALFDEVPVGQVAPKVFDVQGDMFVVRLTKRDEPDMAKFQTEKPKLMASLRQQKAYQAAATYMARRCQDAVAKGGVSYDPSLVSYGSDDGTAATKSVYVPCLTLRE